jgi:hypothetical protein
MFLAYDFWFTYKF